MVGIKRTAVLSIIGEQCISALLREGIQMGKEVRESERECVYEEKNVRWDVLLNESVLLSCPFTLTSWDA